MRKTIENKNYQQTALNYCFGLHSYALYYIINIIVSKTVSYGCVCFAYLLRKSCVFLTIKPQTHV